MNKIAVIGLGNIAERHRRNIRFLFPQATIYATSASGRNVESNVTNCDVLIPTVTDLSKLTNSLDLAIIASPATFHSKHAVPFIEGKVPTLIEKPVVASFSDIYPLIKAVNVNKTPVAVGYCLRYLPSAKILRQLLDENIAGRILNIDISVGHFLPDWRPGNYRDSVSASRSLGGGVLLELSHEIDYAQWLFGELNIQHAIIRNSGILHIDVEDIVDIIATTSEQIIINIHLDFLQRLAYRKCTIIGSEGRLEWDLISNNIALYKATGSEVLFSDINYDKNNAYIDMLKDFIRFSEGRENTCVNLNDGIATISMIEKIKKMAG